MIRRFYNAQFGSMFTHRLFEERRAHLVEVAVRIPHSVGSEILGDLAEQQLALGRIAGARHAARRVGDDRCSIRDETALEQRRERNKNRRRIASGIGDELRATHRCAVQLGHAVGNSLAPVARTEVSG